MSEKTKFVLGAGVLAWRVPMFLVTFLIGRQLPRQLPISILKLLIDLAICLTGGAGFGLALWNLRGRKQRKKQSAG